MLITRIKARQQIIELNRPKRNERQDFKIEPAANSGCQRILPRAGKTDPVKTTGGERLMRSANQEVSKWRNGAWKTHLRSDQISLQMCIRTVERAAGAAEIRLQSKGTNKFEGGSSFPAIQIDFT